MRSYITRVKREDANPPKVRVVIQDMDGRVLRTLGDRDLEEKDITVTVQFIADDSTGYLYGRDS